MTLHPPSQKGDLSAGFIALTYSPTTYIHIVFISYIIGHRNIFAPVMFAFELIVAISFGLKSFPFRSVSSKV